MSDLLFLTAIPAVYVAGVLSGHFVVTWLKTKVIAPLHTKLDALLQKERTSVFTRGK